MTSAHGQASSSYTPKLRPHGQRGAAEPNLADDVSSDTNGHARMRLRPDRFVRDVLVLLGVVTLALLVWKLLSTVLLTLLGLLLGVVLRAGGNATAMLLRTGPRAGLAIFTLVIAMIVAGVVYLLAPSVQQELGELRQRLPEAVMRAEQQLANLGVLPPSLSDRGLYGQLERLGSELFSRAGGIITSTLGVLASLGFVLFVGVYTAVNPHSYRGGFARLFPLRKRPHVHETCDELYDTMRNWMVGKLASMTIVGLLSWTGLTLLGVPLAMTNALLAALFAFVPVIGPIVATLPPALLALTMSPWMALYVVILYVGIQTLESYFITPIIQQKAVSILPALLILAQVVLGTLAGAVGVILAAPLLAGLLVLVKRLYISRLEGDAGKDENPRQLRFWS